MKIGIDCRIYGPKHTGIGRYVQNLVENLLEIDEENDYVLFVRENKDIKITRYQDNKITIVTADIPHYSLKEQLLMPKMIFEQGVDLMHFPHFNVPVLYKGKYIVTIHDLIKHTSKGMQTTTRSPLLYWLKYLGYKIVFWLAVKRAMKILVPSFFVKSKIIKEYGVESEKIAVTYEGVDNKFKSQKSKVKSEIQNSKVLEQFNIKRPYLLYVGSVYPHKNIEKLIEAIKILNNEHLSSYILPLTLIIVCARNVFIERLNKYIVQMNAQEYVNLAGFVSDEDLSVLYQEAEAFVFPTLSEGFGLPGLEAMSVGCPVICSDIPVLREVYQDNAIYFNPYDSKDIAENIKNFLSDKELREKLRNLGPELAEGYSWRKMAKETLEVYKIV